MLESLKKITTKLTKTPEEELMHRELVRVNSQLRMTEKLIKNNASIVQEIAKDNQEVANLFKDVLNNTKRRDLEQRILDRKDISNEDAKFLTSSLSKMTETMSKIGVSFQVNIPDMIKDFKGLVNDTRLDVGQRRDILGDIKTFLDENKIDSASFEELKNLNLNQLNFTEKEENSLSSINTLLDNLVTETSQAKISAKSQLEQLRSLLDSSEFSQDKLKDIFKELKVSFKSQDQADMLEGLLEGVHEGLAEALSQGYSKETIANLKDGIVEGLAEEMDKITGNALESKTYYTLNNLNKAMNSMVLSQDEVKDVMEKQLKDGEKFQEKFEKMAGMFSRGNTKGIILSMLGMYMPATAAMLDELWDGVLDAGKWALGLGLWDKMATGGKYLNKVLSGIRGFFGGISGFIKGLFGKGAGIGAGAVTSKELMVLEKGAHSLSKGGAVGKLLGFGTLGFLGIRAYFAKGSTKALSDKLIEKSVSKIVQAGGDKALSTVTQAYMKTFLKRIPLVGTAISTAFYKMEGDSWSKSLLKAGISMTLIGRLMAIGRAVTIGAGYGSWPGALAGLVIGTGLAFKSDDIINKISDNLPSSKINAIPESLKSKGIDTETKIEKEKKELEEKTRNNQSKIIPVPMGNQQSAKASSNRTLAVDDFGLAFMNSVVFG